MEEKIDFPRYTLDIISALADQTIRRLWIIILALVISLATTNIAWLLYINQYDFESSSIEYSQDGEGLNIIGDGNGVDFNVAES